MAAGFGCRIELGTPRSAEDRGGDQGTPSGTILIYSSMYRTVIDAVTPVLEARLPSVKVEWLQSGSEKLATRLDAELAAGATQADLIMTSDPFWVQRLKQNGHLLPYASIRALAMPRPLVDPEGAFVTSRISTMVIAYNERLIRAEDTPNSFEELFSPRFRGQVTIPDPLSSGTTFTTLAFLVDRMGMEIIEQMKSGGTVSSGGNSSALTRIESGEHKMGFVLLENVLAARRNRSPVAFKVPKEGAVIIPGPIAILKATKNPTAARAVYDALLSEEIQALIVRSDMHSPFESVGAPAGAPPLETLLESGFKWTPAFIDRALGRTEETRRRFAEIMGGH